MADLPAGPPARTFFLFGPPVAVAAAARPLVSPPSTPSPVLLGGDVCRSAGRIAGRSASVPDNLMAAIARVESGRADGKGGTAPWPWSINVEGADHVYDTKADAIAAVRGFQSRGIRSIDVGCMQVNLAYHPDAFASLDQAFEPAANAAYAARYLVQLRGQTGSWDRAVAAYHSANPELGEPYRRRVMAVLPDETRLASATPAGAQPSPGPAGTGFAGGASILSLPPHSPAVTMSAAAGTGQPGRDLFAYRSAPIQVSGRRLPTVIYPSRMPPA